MLITTTSCAELTFKILNSDQEFFIAKTLGSIALPCRVCVLWLDCEIRAFWIYDGSLGFYRHKVSRKTWPLTFHQHTLVLALKCARRPKNYHLFHSLLDIQEILFFQKPTQIEFVVQRVDLNLEESERFCDDPGPILSILRETRGTDISRSKFFTGIVIFANCCKH